MFCKIFKNLIFICLLLALLPQIIAASHSINSHGVRFILPENFRALTLANINRYRAELHEIGYIPEGFAHYLREESMIVYAVSEDWSRQINLRIYESEFSRVVENFNVLNDEWQQHTKQNFLDNIHSSENRTLVNSEFIAAGNVTYIKLHIQVHSEHANFSYMQLFTIANGQNISLTYYNNTPDFTENELAEIENLFNSVSINVRANAGGGFNVLYFTMGIIGLALLLLVLIWAIRAFVKDFIEIRRERKIEHIRHRKR